MTGAEISEGTSMSPTLVADGNADGKASADRIFVEDSGGFFRTLISQLGM